MKESRFKWLSLKNLDGCVISLLSFSLIIAYTHHNGVGISPDSIVYYSVAKNINAAGILVDYNLNPLVDFPVFYPIFLSIANFFSGADLLITAPYLNGLLFACCLSTTSYLIASFEDAGKLYKYVLLLIIAISPSLIAIYSMLWSETLFILLTLIFIVFFRAYLKNHSFSYLMFAASIAGLCCITRYAGITVIATGLMLMVFDQSLLWRKRIIHILSFFLVAIALLLLNLWHNALLTSSLTGPRESGITPLQENVFFYGKVVCGWLAVSNVKPIVISVVAVLSVLSTVLLFVRRSIYQKNYRTAENCFIAFSIVYTVFIIGISTLSHFEGINNRLLSPLFIPLLLSLTSGIPKFLPRLKNINYKIAFAFLSLLTAVFQFKQLKELNGMYDEVKQSGIPGYTDDSWQNSETARFLRNHANIFLADYSIYSNAHEAAYFNGGIKSSSIPHLNDQNDIHDFFAENGQYVIWFNQVLDTELISLKVMAQHAIIKKLYTFKDGRIYFVKPIHCPTKLKAVSLSY